MNRFLQGDSGSSLTIEKNGQHILIGTTSTVNPGGLGGGKFISIAFYRGWIDSEMKAPNFCPGGPNVG